MAQKLYVKPPKQTIGVLLVMAFIAALFLVFGLILYLNVVGELDGYPFLLVSMFFVIWGIACSALIIHYIRLYMLMKTGKIEVGEIGDLSKEFKNDIEVEEVSNSEEESKSDFSSRLRNLDSLKKDALISEDEYTSKRKEIMDEKW